MTFGTTPNPIWRRSFHAFAVSGEVEIFGGQYAMRVWINPDKLTQFRLTMQDVVLALRAYNVEISAGQFGGAPGS